MPICMMPCNFMFTHQKLGKDLLLGFLTEPKLQSLQNNARVFEFEFCVCVCVCVRACVRACVRVCVCVFALI